MARALPCSQPPSDAPTAAVDLSGLGTIFGPAFDNFAISPSFCSAIGSGGAAMTSELHRTLNRPALLIVSDRDDRTPPANAAALDREFRDATTLVVSEGGHELLPVPEVQRAVIDFFRGRSVRGRRLSVPPMRYLSIEEARLPERRPER